MSGQIGDYRQITLGELAKIDDGRLAIAFAEELKRAAEDCENRPAVKTPRKVTIEMTVVPVLDDDGSCSELRQSFNFKSTIPKRASKVYSTQLRKNGIIAYRPNSEDNHAQSNFLPTDDTE